MKRAKVKSDLQVRAALRASQERRLEHAFDVMKELIGMHHTNPQEMEHDVNEVWRIYNRLLVAIRNQHVKDRTVAAKRVLEGY